MIQLAFSKAPVLAAAKSAKAADVSAYRAGRVNAGFTVSGQLVDIDAAGRADLTSMMGAANASLITLLAGTATWPSNYATGWVARAGGLLPLPKATDGIKLAAAALNYYSALVQREAVLVKAVNAAATLAALAAIDITAGWPSAS